MKEVYEFFVSALPWVGIGLFVACSSVSIKAKVDRKELSKFFKELSWTPMFCFTIVAIMEMFSGNISNATTWLVLGVFNAVVNYANIRSEINR